MRWEDFPNPTFRNQPTENVVTHEESAPQLVISYVPNNGLQNNGNWGAVWKLTAAFGKSLCNRNRHTSHTTRGEERAFRFLRQLHIGCPLNPLFHIGARPPFSEKKILALTVVISPFGVAWTCKIFEVVVKGGQVGHARIFPQTCVNLEPNLITERSAFSGLTGPRTAGTPSENTLPGSLLPKLIDHRGPEALVNRGYLA